MTTQNNNDYHYQFITTVENGVFCTCTELCSAVVYKAAAKAIAQLA